MSVDLLQQLSLEYRGRIPKRVDGIQRRDKILAAAESIIVAHGIQGVKHRAIAELADVPLAATTYYFEDLPALLHDVFINFTQRNLSKVASLESAVIKQIEKLAQAEELQMQPEQMNKLLEKISELIYKHILQQVADRHDRLIERAYANEALRNPEVAEIVNGIEIIQLRSIAEIFRLLGSEQPDIDARELLGVILFLEHRLLTGVIKRKDARLTISSTVKRLASWTR